MDTITTASIKIRPWSENLWFSPRYVINELTQSIRSGNKKNIKRNKEAWICAVAIICHSKIRNEEWWIQVPQKDPPDVLAMKLVPNIKGSGENISLLLVEVFEISAHDKESIEKSIERKLGVKDYSGMTLIGFVRREGIFDHENVATYIQKLKPKVLCVILIVSEEKSTNFSYIQLFPECVKFKYDFGLFCKTTKQRDFIELRRGTKTKKDDAITNDKLTLIP
jgi:hypothetical protein